MKELVITSIFTVSNGTKSADLLSATIGVLRKATLKSQLQPYVTYCVLPTCLRTYGAQAKIGRGSSKILEAEILRSL